MPNIVMPADANVVYPKVLVGYNSPKSFTIAHANDDATVDLSINDDLVDTRGPDDHLAVFEDVGIQLASANQSWINVYHGAYNISNRTQKPEHIVVHYTGSGTSKAGAAKNNCIYFSGGNRNASADFFIDDSGIWEYADSDKYYTWHCGDGKGAYGITNARSVGIEVCLNGDNPYTGAEIEHLQRLVLFLMNKYSIPASKVVRHYDASRKQCPMYYAKRDGEWNALKAKITSQPAPPKPTVIHTVRTDNYSDAKEQQWFIRGELKDGAEVAFRNVGNYLWLSDPGSSKTQTNAQVWEGQGGNDGNQDPREPQILIAHKTEIEGAWEFCPKVAPNLALDISGADTNAGAQVQFYQRNGTLAQRFYVAPYNGKFRLVSPMGFKPIAVRS